MEFGLNFGIIWFGNHGKRPGGGAAEFRSHGFPECQNRISHASPSDKNFCAGEASSCPKAQLRRSAGREFLRSATPCAPPRMEVLRFILERVCDGENRKIEALGASRTFCTHPLHFYRPSSRTQFEDDFKRYSPAHLRGGKLSKSGKIAFSRRVA